MHVSLRTRALAWSRVILPLTSLGLVSLCATGCSDDTNGSAKATTGTGSAAGGGGAGGEGGSTGPGFPAGGSTGDCDDRACAEDEVCTEGDVCCPIDQACNSLCCATTEACSFGGCAPIGADCQESGDCAEDEYCEYSLGEPLPPPGPGCISGAPVSTGKCLPKPPICPTGEEPNPQNPTCVTACELQPQTSTFAATLKHAWGGEVTAPFSTDVMMTPLVISLDDDDCDGEITDRDIPEIVFSTFQNGGYNSAGVLHAISIVEGVVVDKWTAPDIQATRQLAAGNIDGLPGTEIVGCTQAGAVRAWNGEDGSVLWTSAPMNCFMPSLADLQADGDVEVIVEGGILEGATGILKNAFSVPVASSFVVSDVTGDGVLNIVTGSQIYDAQGILLVDTGVANTSSFYATQNWKSPWPAIGDFDADGTPEIVVVDNMNHQLSIWRANPAMAGGFEIVRAPVDINGAIPPSACPVGSWGNTHGGGPPTIADFTGDGIPDVATAGGVGYVVLNGESLMNPAIAGVDTIEWINPTVDCSSASTGSTVFDFNGDGVAEVVYGDQQRIRIYDGPTGNVLFEVCNTTGTLIENPVVADVDNDGQADIVAAANAYASGGALVQCDDGVSTGQAGIRVFGSIDDSWVRTRRVWNEHAYHVTNVSEDGTIPTVEAENWLTPGLNNFRQNKQPGKEFAAPDAVVSIAPRCAGAYGLLATVRNLGEAALAAGVVVTFYQGAPGTGTVLGQATTQSVLFPAESEQLALDINPPLTAGTISARIESTPQPECRADNNDSATVSAKCDSPK